jgi:membrane protein implicated in regulation of membrane protease activity
MDLSGATGWWIGAGVLVAAELASGTFYLLMLALGAVAAWHLKRTRQPAATPAAKNPDVNLDIGGTVQVAQWSADGTAQVSYRGANWAVRYAGRGPPHPGAHVIRAVEGSCLLLERSPHPH